MEYGTEYPEGQDASTNTATCSVSFDAWAGSVSRLGAAYSPRRTFLGPLHEEARVTLEGPTGEGKSMVGMGWSSAIAKGIKFGRWSAGTAARWLYLDYEMGYREVRDRLEMFQAPKLTVICFDDPQLGADGLLPIDTPRGQDQVVTLLSRSHSAGVTLDNLYSAVEGSILGGSGDGQAHSMVVPFLRHLSKAKKGVLLLAHMNGTGDIYGDKRLTWQMTSRWQVARQKTPEGELTVKLTNKKQRGADGLALPLTMEFKRGAWRECVTATPKRDSHAEASRVAFGVTTLNSVAPVTHPGLDDIPAFVTVRLIEDWRGALYEAYEKNHPNAKPGAEKQEFSRTKTLLINRGIINTYDDFVWFPPNA